MSDALPEKPASLGDLVGLAFRLFRADWKQFVARLFWPSLFSSLCMYGTNWTLVHWINGRTLAVDWFVIHMLVMFACVVVVILCQWEIALRSVALLRNTLAVSPSYEEGLAYARRRQWAVMIVYSISFLAPFIVGIVFGAMFVATVFVGQFGSAGLVASIALAFIEGLALVVVGSFAVLLTGLCFLVIACETLKVGEALRRGVYLALRYKWRGASFISLLFASIFSVNLGVFLPVVLLAIYHVYTSAASTATGQVEFPFYIRALEVAETTVTSIVSVAIGMVGTGLYYRDMTLRVEGRDLIESLERLQARS
ncbi:MAG: hypothetical protein KC777_04125 [Cyanobacteria bacterium HKST-UBA02]|nr:hypothetical protein [Cyanobacteria bacterium HKST-UBA02]